MKRALIIGVTGQDGGYLALELLRRGYHVCGTSRDPQNANLKGLSSLRILNSVELLRVDPESLESISSTIKGSSADYIINLSGQSSVGKSLLVPFVTVNSHVSATLHILEAIRTSGRDIHFVNASSGECFGDQGVTCCDENSDFRPTSPYAAAKAAASLLVRAYRASYGLAASNAFLYSHESPMRPLGFFSSRVVQAARSIHNGHRGFIEFGDLNVIRDWGWAEEYMAAVASMLDMPEPCDLVVASGRPISAEQYLDAVFAEAGLDWHEHVRIRADLFRPNEARYMCGAVGKAQSVIGWNATTVGVDVARRQFREFL